MATPSRLNSETEMPLNTAFHKRCIFQNHHRVFCLNRNIVYMQPYYVFFFCSFFCDPARLLILQNRQKAVFPPPSSAVQQPSSTVLSVPEKQDGDGGRTNNREGGKKIEDWSPAQMLAGKSVATKLHFDLPPVSADSLHSGCSAGLYSMNPPLSDT